MRQRKKGEQEVSPEVTPEETLGGMKKAEEEAIDTMPGATIETVTEETITPTMALMVVMTMTMDRKQTSTKTRIGNQKVQE